MPKLILKASFYHILFKYIKTIEGCTSMSFKLIIIGRQFKVHCVGVVEVRVYPREVDTLLMT